MGGCKSYRVREGGRRRDITTELAEEPERTQMVESQEHSPFAAQGKQEWLCHNIGEGRLGLVADFDFVGDNCAGFVADGFDFADGEATIVECVAGFL
jgi:hypothetical protein